MQVYLDNAASTCLDEEAMREMMPFLRETYANPSGACSFSAKARSAVEKARERVAGLIGAAGDEIVFTSGGTEADNMAILGVATESVSVPKMAVQQGIFGAGTVTQDFAEVSGSLGKSGRVRNKIITSKIEHPAVLESCKEAERRGYKVLYAPCDKNGRIDISFIKRNTDKSTLLVSIMTANNELGTIQDIREIAGIAHEAGALFHTDAVQAAGHIPLNVRESGADLLSISSHKLHGPKGIGALYVRRGVKIAPVSFGGGQEKGLRSGTLNVPAIVGFGKACEIARESMEHTVSNMARMREYFIDGLKKSIEEVHINGADSLPSIVSVSFDGIEGSSLLIELDMRGICCSTGSACSASKEGPSHVLLTAGLSEERIRGAMRFSFSKYTTYEELDHTVKAVGECVERLRRIRNI